MATLKLSAAIKRLQKKLDKDGDIEIEITYRKKIPDNLHKKLIALYFDWFERKEGFKPKFDGSDGKGAKELLTYLKSICKTEQEILDTFNQILTNWNKVDLYYQKQTRMRQINSNLQGIIQSIKHGRKGKTNQKATANIIASFYTDKY